MKRAYIAGAYRAPTESGVRQNIERARAVAERMWAKGYAAFCPHLNTAFMGGVCPDHYFLEGDLEWLRFTSFVVLVDGWEQSKGTQAEIAYAHKMHIPVLTEAEADALPNEEVS